MRVPLRTLPGLVVSVVGTSLACFGVSGAATVTACPSTLDLGGTVCPGGGALSMWLLVLGSILTIVGLAATLRETPRLAPYLFALPCAGCALTAALLVMTTDSALVREQQTPVLLVAAVMALTGIAGGIAIRRACDRNVAAMLSGRLSGPAARAETSYHPRHDAPLAVGSGRD